MNISRILNVKCSSSPAALVLLFSAALLLLAGCPQPTSNDNSNDNGSGQGAGDTDTGLPAQDQPGDSGASGDTQPPADNPGDSGTGDQGGPGGDNPPPPVATPGDMNGDGTIDAQDVRGFVLALLDIDAFLQAYPDGDPLMADANGDGVVNSFDIDAFRELVLGQ